MGVTGSGSCPVASAFGTSSADIFGISCQRLGCCFIVCSLHTVEEPEFYVVMRKVSKSRRTTRYAVEHIPPGLDVLSSKPNWVCRVSVIHYFSLSWFYRTYACFKYFSSTRVTIHL